MTHAESVIRISRSVIAVLESLAPLADLGIRLWVAHFFWASALTKIFVDATFPFVHVSPTTFMLFELEYQVPLLSPAVAAWLGTYVELVFPLLLAAGLGGRFAATVLFVFNIVAVISYPALQTAGQLQHALYGTLLLLPLLRGPGMLSFDHLIRKRWLN